MARWVYEEEERGRKRTGEWEGERSSWICMGQTERDEDEIRADLFFLPFILYHPYFILALTATATRYAVGDGPRCFLSLRLVQNRRTTRNFLIVIFDITYKDYFYLKSWKRKVTAAQQYIYFFMYILMCIFYIFPTFFEHLIVYLL